MKSDDLNTTYIGIGSNKGNKFENFRRAIESINGLNGSKVEKISSLYESLPFGNLEQNVFLNAVIKVSTTFDPKKLFIELKKIERVLGRVIREKWGPREIDLDILFYNDLIFSDEIITLPHKGIIYRDFVLVPLIEIEPDLIHPVFNKKIIDFVSELKTKNIINKLSEPLFTEENQIDIK